MRGKFKFAFPCNDSDIQRILTERIKKTMLCVHIPSICLGGIFIHVFSYKYVGRIIYKLTSA